MYKVNYRVSTKSGINVNWFYFKTFWNFIFFIFCCWFVLPVRSNHVVKLTRARWNYPVVWTWRMNRERNSCGVQKQPSRNKSNISICGSKTFEKYQGSRVRFEVLTAVSTKMDIFWVVAPCKLVDVYQRFRGPCCLHHQGDDAWWWR
jgi:hypothetical protein